MPFGLRAQMGRRNHVLDAGPEVLRYVAMATIFWPSMGYNFGCMIASDTLFDSRGGFSGSSYPIKHSRFRGSKGRCHGDYFRHSICGVHIGTTWRI